MFHLYLLSCNLFPIVSWLLHSQEGGLSFIYGSQPIENQAEMVRKVKKFKAGFVESEANLTPEHTLKDVLELKKGQAIQQLELRRRYTSGKFFGIVTSRDYRVRRQRR